jgi:O-glycosyl hydrolase
MPVVLAQAVVVSGHTEAAAAGPDVIPITKDGAYRFGGWGVSLAWWANTIGGWSSAARGPIETALFGLPDANHQHGLGLNVIRYNIGASPATSTGTGPPTVSTGVLPDNCRGFQAGGAVPVVKSSANAPVDLSRDGNQVQLLTEASKLVAAANGVPPVLEAFANSPPWWMTETKCPQGNGNKIGSVPVNWVNNLSDTNYRAYADFLIDVLKAFRDRGINFGTIDPFNEPGNAWLQQLKGDSNQEGAHFDPPAQNNFLPFICHRLNDPAFGLNTRVASPDGFRPGEMDKFNVESTIDDYNHYSDENRQCLANVNTHMYWSKVTIGHGLDLQPYNGTQRRALAALIRDNNSRLKTFTQLWMSEFGNGGSANDLGAGLTLSGQIAKDLQYLRPTVWSYWQAAEPQNGWGLFEVPNSNLTESALANNFPNQIQSNTVTPTRRFFALEQYSRFIRPAFRVLTPLDPQRSDNAETNPTVAAVDDLRAPQRIVIVGTNTTGKARDVRYDLGPLGIGGLDRAGVTRYRTDPSGNMQQLDTSPANIVSGNQFSDQQPDNSITTYVVDFPPGLPGTGSPPATQLTYTGPATADYHDPFTASATLTAEGSQIPGEPVTFALGSGSGTQTCTGTTDSSGSASCALTPNQAAGPATLTASFAGTNDLLPSSTSVPFTITREETTVSYTGPGRVANGVPANLSGVLKEDGTAPIAGRAASISLGSGTSQQTCSGTTDSAGAVSCTIPSVNQPLNDTATVPVTISFTGDAFYLPSTGSATVRLEFYTGRAFGISASLNLPLLTVGVPPTPDTGPIRIAQASTTTTPCTASISAVVVTADALCPNVTTRLAPGTSIATSTVAHVTIGIPGVSLIEISGATASSTSTCGSATGSTSLTLRIAGTPLTVPTPPNSEIDLPDGTRLIINEQQPVAGADNGLTVNAVHIILAGGVGDVVVASATSDVHNCS